MNTSAFKVSDQHGTYIADRPVSEDEIIDMAASISRKNIIGTNPLKSPDLCRRYIRAHMQHLEHEVFSVIYLNSQHTVISYQELFRGTVDECRVHPREILKSSLKVNAAAAIFVHNHPSGNSTPSTSDKKLTRSLVELLTIVDVRVLDHLVVGDHTIK